MATEEETVEGSAATKKKPISAASGRAPGKAVSARRTTAGNSPNVVRTTTICAFQRVIPSFIRSGASVKP